jgi:hypothetical protein
VHLARTARFRKINEENLHQHHDAIELPDGTTVLLSNLIGDQCATVLQLPAQAATAKGDAPAAPEQTSASAPLLHAIGDTRLRNEPVT